MKIRVDRTREAVETGCYLARDCFTCPFQDCRADAGRLRRASRSAERGGRHGAHGRRAGEEGRP